MLKLLWEYFPKKLKKYLFPSTIILSLLSTLAYLFISDHIISLSIPALMQLLLVFTIYFIIVTIIGFFISYNKIIYFLYDIIKNNYSNEQHSTNQKIKVITKKEKKHIPYQFELEVLNHNIIEHTVFIGRKWYPNEVRPGIESFLNAIDFSEPRCGKCQSDFYKYYGSIEYVECTNPDCKNKDRIYADDLYTINQQIQTRFKGNVRNKYDEYWKKYKNIYDDYTNKNYEEYLEPRS